MSNRDAWNRCDVCGRFISMADFWEGRATRRMDAPDSDRSAEGFETLCRDHSPHTKAYRERERKRLRSNAATLDRLFA